MPQPMRNSLEQTTTTAIGIWSSGADHYPLLNPDSAVAMRYGEAPAL
jgi:hypothetical protein